ncbi:hypothetical protein K6R49_003726 [Escherichia coli]|uniref:phage baseplate protein n=1 Tax=Buttiauxella noackiae TaxID=82992 RepID=UPI001A0DE367|nr:hypothetical protein [Escherichia coli]MBJ0329694.1 hypothetical protein [Escherichia coli]
MSLFSNLALTSRDNVYFNAVNNLNQVFSLSATEEYSSKSSYSISNQPTVDVNTVTDNINRQPRQVTLTGVFVSKTSYQLFGNGTVASANDFVGSVELLRQQKQVISLHLPNGLSLLQCFITSFDTSADKTIVNGLRVSMTFDEIIVTPQKLGKASTTVQGGNSDGGIGSKFKTTAKGSVVTEKQVGRAATSVGSSRTVCGFMSESSNYQGNDNRVFAAQKACNEARLGQRTNASAESIASSNMQDYQKQVSLKKLGGNINKNYLTVK